MISIMIKAIMAMMTMITVISRNLRSSFLYIYIYICIPYAKIHAETSLA